MANARTTAQCPAAIDSKKARRTANKQGWAGGRKTIAIRLSVDDAIVESTKCRRRSLAAHTGQQGPQMEDNPVFKALRRKERQLSSVPRGTLRCIFLGDAGCRILWDLRDRTRN